MGSSRQHKLLHPELWVKRMDTHVYNRFTRSSIINMAYRGELQVIVLNAGSEPFTVERGMKIAQAVLAPVTRAAWREVETLGDSPRGEGGFGSTGTG
jgi:deoxyuridine 5'-triphosphate nucleotidohydrolase